MPVKHDIQTEWLVDRYVNDKLSTRQIASLLGRSKTFVTLRLRGLGILRPPVIKGAKRDAPWLRGENHPNWKGGKKVNGSGEYTRTGKVDGITQYAKTARLIMAEHIGRELQDTEVVHHINRNSLDNRIENLQLLPNQAEHARIHIVEINFRRWGYVPDQRSQRANAPS